MLLLMRPIVCCRYCDHGWCTSCRWHERWLSVWRQQALVVTLCLMTTHSQHLCTSGRGGDALGKCSRPTQQPCEMSRVIVGHLVPRLYTTDVSALCIWQTDSSNWLLRCCSPSYLCPWTAATVELHQLTPQRALYFTVCKPLATDITVTC